MSDGATGSAAALPAYFEFVAPTGWQTIDILSDLHLAPTLPRTFEAFARHLRETRADAVLLLGDIFEVWIGDDARRQPFERLVVEAIADGAARRNIAFMVGNRDFLVGLDLLRAAGMMGLPDPTVLDAWGQRVLLTHGDALCLADTEYQRFRAQVRGEAWRREFLAKPLAERARIASGIREQSMMRRRLDTRADADIDPAEAVRWLHGMGAAEMVHGHTHRPGSEALAPGYRRHVLSDWDLDDAAYPRAEVLRLTRDGFTRVPVAARR